MADAAQARGARHSARQTLFQPEMFQEFAETFRHTVRQRLDALRQHLRSSGQPTAHVHLEPEIKAVMLEMLANDFFGADLPYEQLRNRFVPALERMIDHIVRDTVTNASAFRSGNCRALRTASRRQGQTMPALTN